ncbi:hypothetical protein F4814DRAFT_235795 [Daldinia grandis]|nr:hypothetical protein F4814DRAFT_235795 [Daldinia grandis]
MAQTRCLVSSSPARALHRVLVSDLLSRSRTTSLTPRTTSSYLLPPRLFSSSRLVTKSNNTTTLPPQQTRPLSTTSVLRRIDLSQKRPTNGNIPYPYVRVVGPPPDNALPPAQPLDSVLATINLQTHTLAMVAPPLPEAEPDTPEAEAAICRVIDNAAASAASAAAKAAIHEAEMRARRKAANTKELEFSWGISPNDLRHKLRRLHQFLDLGLNVEVILAKKRGAKPVSGEAAEAVLEAVRGTLALVDGAKEVRKMDGNVGGMVRLYFEGPSSKRKRKKKELEQEQKELEEKEKEKEKEEESG